MQRGAAVPKYSVHIPEQTVIVDADWLEGEMLVSSQAGQPLILWDQEHGAFAQLAWEYRRISD
jgi:hypothetical protein